MSISNSSYPYNEADLASYYAIEGNAFLPEAEIVIIANNPLDPSRARANVAAINQIWNDHLILVDMEGYENKIKAVQHELTCGIKRVDANIRGWDHPLWAPQLTRLCEKEKVMKSLIENVNKEVGKLPAIHFRESQAYQTFINFIFEPIRKTNNKKKIENFQKKIELLEKYPLYPSPDHPFCVPYFVRLFDFIDHAQKEFKQNFTNYYLGMFTRRQVSLKAAIQSGLRESNKVMVCVTCNHVFFKPRSQEEEYNSVQKIRDFLETKKYVILTPKNSPLSIEDQPSLWQVSHKSCDQENKNSPLPLPHSQTSLLKKEKDVVALSDSNQKSSKTYLSALTSPLSPQSNRVVNPCIFNFDEKDMAAFKDKKK